MTSATPKPRAGEHTKGPWQVSPEQESHGDRLCIQDSHGFIIARVPFGEPCDEANARLIVACVNACEGYPTEGLEMAIPGSFFTATDTIAERDLLRERERELVEILGKLLDVAKRANIEVPMSDAPVFFAARALLAKHGR